MVCISTLSEHWLDTVELHGCDQCKMKYNHVSMLVLWPDNVGAIRPDDVGALA